MKKSLAVLAMLVAWAAMGATDIELRGTPAEMSDYLLNLPGTVSLTGIGETEIQPDSGVVALVVATEASTLQAATKLNAELRKRVIEILEKAGIDKAAIKSDRFPSIPQVGLPGGTTSLLEAKAKGNKVEHVLEVTFKEESQLEAVAQAADSLAEVTLGGVLFNHSQEEKLKIEARLRACGEVASKKAAYEKALGVKLRPKRIEEDPLIVQRSWRKSDHLMGGKLLKGATAPQGQPVFPDYDTDMSLFGTIIYRARVTVEYHVETAVR